MRSCNRIRTGLLVSSAPDRQTATVTVTDNPQPAAWDRSWNVIPPRPTITSGRGATCFRARSVAKAVYLALELAREITGILPLVILDTSLFGRFAVCVALLFDYGGVVASDEAVGQARRRGGAPRRGPQLEHVELRHLDQRFTTTGRRSA